MDEQGVRYTTPDGEEYVVTPDRILAQSWTPLNKICWHLDDKFRKKRFRGRLITLRVLPSMKEFLDQVMQREEYHVEVDPEIAMRQNKRCVWIMMLVIFFYPGSLLPFLHFLGTPEVANNQVGQRFLIGLAILKITLFVIVLSVTVVGINKLRLASRSKRLQGVTRDGIHVADPNGEDMFFPYRDLHAPSSVWGLHFIQLTSRDKILLPNRQMIHDAIIRANTDPIRLPSIQGALWFAVPLLLAGPVHYFWNMYLIPYEPYANELFRYFVLPIFGGIILLNTIITRWWKLRQLKRTPLASQ